MLASTVSVAAILQRWLFSAIIIHQWLFDEPVVTTSNGRLAIDSIGSINGTLVAEARCVSGDVYASRSSNTNLNSTAATVAAAGPAILQIDGSNAARVSFGVQTGRFGSADFAIAFWVRTSEQLRLFDLIGNRRAPSHGNFVSVRMTGRHESSGYGRLVFEVDEDESGRHYAALASNTVGLNDGRWHHVVALRMQRTLGLFVDGRLDAVSDAADTTGVAHIDNGNDFRIGKSLDMPDRFAPLANFDDVRIYVGAAAASVVNGGNGKRV